MIDCQASKILILFYKTDFSLIYRVPLWIPKKFQNHKIYLILESSGHRKNAANFTTSGWVQKKLLRLKNAIKLPEPPCFVDF